MVKSDPPSSIDSEDYEAIQSAVMETSRGRWFLAEYAKHNRTADTEILLAAIAKLHSALIQQEETADPSRIKNELLDIAGAIADTKQEIGAMSEQDGDDGLATANVELDAIVTSAEKATGDILNHAEQIQEIAWTLRENGIDEESCAALDGHATEIYTACSFQDLTGQRTQKIIKILTFIDLRIEAIMGIWNPNERADGILAATPENPASDDARPDAHLLNGPQIEAVASSQEEIDEVLDDDFFEGTVAIEDDVEVFEPTPEPDPPEPDMPEPGRPESADLAPPVQPDINDPPVDTSDEEFDAAGIPAPDVDPPIDRPDISASSNNTDATTLEASQNVSDLSDSHKMALFS